MGVFLRTVGTFGLYGWLFENSDSVLTFVSHIVSKLDEYEIFENCPTAMSMQTFQTATTDAGSYVRTHARRRHPTDGRDANRIGERRRGDGDGDGDDVERDGWK